MGVVVPWFAAVRPARRRSWWIRVRRWIWCTIVRRIHH